MSEISRSSSLMIACWSIIDSSIWKNFSANTLDFVIKISELCIYLYSKFINIKIRIGTKKTK